jgi:hypothetical protein
VIDDSVHAALASAVSAAIEAAVSLDAMADDPAATVAALRCQAMDGAFEAVEDMPRATAAHFERGLVVVSAHFALGHASHSISQQKAVDLLNSKAVDQLAASGRS